jgi:NADH-quinone oxidoreductase subunit N
MDRSGVSGVLFYLAAYGFTTIGAFALVTLVRSSTPEGGVGGEATHLSQWAGLGKRSPWLAAVFALFLISFAGIPLTSGFSGKFAIFSAAFKHAPYGPGLVLVGVLASAIAVFFYVRVIVLMYFSESIGDAVTVTRAGALTKVAIGVGVAATIVLGVAPDPALHLAHNASVFLP